MWRTESFEETLMLGKIEGRKRRGRQRMRWLDGITISMDMSKLLEIPFQHGVLQSMGSQRIRHDWVTELNWTDQCLSFFKRKWRMDLSYLVNMCLFSLNSLIVTSLPGGSSDLLQKGSSRCPLPGCQICLNPSKKSFSVPSMFDKSGFIWADWRLNCKY